MSGALFTRSLPAPKQLKFTPGIANGSVKESPTLLNPTQKVTYLINATLVFCIFSLLKNVNIIDGADGNNWASIHEEFSSCRTNREALEVEEKSSSVVAAVQVEVAKAMETLRMD